jgi:hypothetical protein
VLQCCLSPRITLRPRPADPDIIAKGNGTGDGSSKEKHCDSAHGRHVSGGCEGTIVTIAAPTITKDLSGFDLISLVFSVYFLTSAVSTPITANWRICMGGKTC